MTTAVENKEFEYTKTSLSSQMGIGQTKLNMSWRWSCILCTFHLK